MGFSSFQVAPIRGPMWKTEDNKANSSKPQPESGAAQSSESSKNQRASQKSPPNPSKSPAQQNQAAAADAAQDGPAVRKRTAKANRMGALFEKSN